jgi:hypothetical protein
MQLSNYFLAHSQRITTTVARACTRVSVSRRERVRNVALFSKKSAASRTIAWPHRPPGLVATDISVRLLACTHSHLPPSDFRPTIQSHCPGQVHQRHFIASAAASEADLNAAPSCHRIRAPTCASSHAHKTYFPALQAGRPPSVKLAPRLPTCTWRARATCRPLQLAYS